MSTQTGSSTRSLSIRAKLAIQAAVVLVGIAALTLASFSTLNKLKVTGPVYTQIIQDKDLLADILPPPAYIVESYLVTNRMATETDPKALEALAVSLVNLEKSFHERMDLWERELAPSEIKEKLVTAARPPAEVFFKIAGERFVPAVRAGNAAETRKILEEELRPNYETHRAAIDRVVELEVASAAAREAAAKDMLAFRTAALMVLAGVVAVISGLGCILIGRSTVRRIPALTDFASALAKGDLTARLRFNTNDEFGRLGSALDQAVESINHVVSQVSTSATEVAGAATQIAAAAEEMSASVGEVARQAGEASGSANNSGTVAKAGGEVVQKTVVEMKQIADAVNQTATNIRTLGERSEQIGLVIGVINDIADQTNLLALNAAIEAARAGEHGRGFAVVADEVRKLAERTTKATEEVSSSIKAIQDETRGAVDRMNHGTEQVRVGVGLAEQAGANLGQIVEGAGQVAALITSISAASEEAGAATTQSAQAAQELSTKAESLRQLCSRFKTNAAADNRASGPVKDAAREFSSKRAA